MNITPSLISSHKTPAFNFLQDKYEKFLNKYTPNVLNRLCIIQITKQISLLVETTMLKAPHRSAALQVGFVICEFQSDIVVIFSEVYTIFYMLSDEKTPTI